MYLYFMQAASGGAIKIGTARLPDKRLEALQRGHPEELRLVGIALGGHGAERRLHDLFAEYRVHGEWFSLCEPLSDLISRLPDWPAVCAGAEPPRVLADVDVYRDLYETGYSMNDIADHFGVTRQRIHQVVTARFRQGRHMRTEKPELPLRDYFEQNRHRFVDCLAA